MRTARKAGESVRFVTATVMAVLCTAAAVLPGTAHAAQGVNGISSTYDDITDTGNDYSTAGGGSPGFPVGTTYSIRFNSGNQNNLEITGFQVGTNNYKYIQLSDRINLERVPNPVIVSNHHIILYEDYNVAGTNVDLKPSYVATTEASLRSENVNRGADNVFCNQGDDNGNNNNIERIDYIFSDGYPLHDNVDLRGFLVMDRGGNDPFQISAITNLSLSGAPTGFSATVSIPDTTWGWSGISIDTTVLRGYIEDGDVQHPSAAVDPQDLDGVFIPWIDFGLQTNDVIFGYSLRANDMPPAQDWLAVTNYPLATAGTGDGGLDLMSGGAMFFDVRLNGTIGDLVWDDLNGNGIQDDGEPGISNLLVRAYDSRTNLAAVTRSDTNGHYEIRGLAPDDYFAEFVLPTGYTFSPANVGTNDLVDSDADTNTARTAVFSISSGSSNMTVDAGMHRTPTDIGVSKTVNDNHPNVSNTVVYTIIATNNGPATGNLIQITDLWPTSITYTGYSASKGTYTSTNGIWDLGTLTNGKSAMLVITGIVNSGTAGKTITNRAGRTQMDRPDSNSSNDWSNAVLVVQMVDLGVLKIVNDSMPKENTNITYTIMLTNAGPDTATGIVITDLLPTGLIYSNATPSTGTYNTVGGTWSNFNLASGSTAALSILATVSNGTAGTSITNTATVTTRTQVDTNPANDTASVAIVVAAADLGVTKTVDNSAPTEGASITYSIVVTNLGPSATTGAQFTDLLPAGGVTYVSHVAGQGSFNSTSGVWSAGSLGLSNGASLTITAQVKTNTLGKTYTNSVSVTGNDLPDPNSSNNDSEAVIYISGLRITKTSDVVGFATPGSNITYTIIVTNIGAGTHSGVTVTDPVPVGTTFVTSSVTVVKVPPATSQTNNARDTFTVVAYTNSNGNTNWAGAWQETGDDASAATGAARVSGGTAVLSTNTSLRRVADLSQASSATLSFNCRQGVQVETNNVRDEFLYRVYTNNDGSVAWAGNWTEINDDGSATGGEVQILNEISNYQLKVERSGRGISRFANLSPATNATLSFLFKRVGLDDVNDYVAIEITTNGTTWIELDRFADTGSDDPGYISTNYNITAYRSAATGIRLIGSPGLGNNDRVYFDDVDITYTQPVHETNDIATVAISSNGTTWATLMSVAGNIGTSAISTNFDIFNYRSTNTSVRFAVTNYQGQYEMFRFDDVDVTFVTSSDSGYSGNPPVLATNYTLSSGQALTINFTVKVDNPTTYTQVINTASVRSQQQPSPGSATVIDPIINADLGVTKSVDISAPLPGSNVVYTIVLTNNGPADATGIEIFEPLTNGITYVSHVAGSGAYNSTTKVWSVSSLNVGLSASLSISAAVGTNTVGWFITNVSTITASDQADVNPANNQASNVIAVVGVDIGVAKGVDDSTPYEGNDVTYTVIVTNYGPSAATGVSLTDLIPTNLSYKSHVAGSGSYDSGSGLWSGLSLVKNASANLTIVANVKVGTAGKTITNTVRVTTVSQPETTTTNNSASVTIVPQAPPLNISKTSDATAPVNPGGVITYTIIVTNISGDVQTGVTVSDAIPPGVTYSSGTCRVTGPTVTNDTFRDQFDTRLYDGNMGTATWTGNWEESEGDGATNGNQEVRFDAVRGATYTFQFEGGGGAWLRRQANLGGYTNAVLSFDYRRDGLGDAGDSVAIEVSSNGFGGTWTPVASIGGATTDVAYLSTNISISQYIATNTAVRLTSSAATMGVNDIVWFDDIQIAASKTAVLTKAGNTPPTLASGYELAPGNSMTVTLDVVVDDDPAVFKLTNVASVVSIEMPVAQSASVTDTVAVADLGVTKVCNTNKVSTNGVLWYTITLKNNGPNDATNIKLVDYWPTNAAAHVIFSNAVPDSGSYDSTNHTWSVGSLTSGLSTKLVITGQVQAVAKNLLITNSIQITELDQYDNNAANDRASDIIGTLVVLARIEAYEVDGTVVVEWETASEIGTAGFYLYRRTGAGRVAVNNAIIPAIPGTQQGSVYRTVDETASRGKTYVYELVEIETRGACNTYGPFTLYVEPRDASAFTPDNATYSVERRISEGKVARSRTKKEAASARAASSGRRDTLHRSTKKGGGGKEFVPLKIATRYEGITIIQVATVAKTLGADEADVMDRFATGNVELQNRGTNVAYRWEEALGGVIFFAEKMDSIYTDDNVYWLAWTNGLQMAAADGGSPAQGQVGIFTEALHFEEERYRAPALATDPESDYWLWEYFVGGDPNNGVKSFVVSLPAVADEDGAETELSVQLQASTSTGFDPEHHVVVRMNGVQVAERKWSGTEKLEILESFDQSLLTDGNNVLEITALLDAGVKYSIVYLDSFNLSYRRNYQVAGNSLKLNSESNSVVTAVGFSAPDIRVVNITDPLQPEYVSNVTVNEDAGTYNASFVAAGADNSYVVFTPDGIKNVESLTARTAMSLRAVTNDTRYIVITVPDLIPAAENLVTYRRQLGLSGKTVLLDDIYDEFSYGLATPYAIRDFLEYACSQWSVPPGYVLLAGEGTYEYRNLIDWGDNLIPPLMAATPHGLAAADNLFADFDGDGAPEIAVGRLPAMTDEELQMMVDKIIAYENDGLTGWQTTMLLCADSKDARGGDFEMSSETIAGLAPPWWTLNRVYVDQLGDAARGQLLAALNSGTVFMNYFGHAGTDRIAGGRLKSSDVSLLSNSSRPAIVTAMTCVIGGFAIPGYDCLGEELILRQGGGAVAVWAPSGVSYNQPAEALTEEFYRAVFKDGQGILGDAVLQALKNYAADDRTPYMLRIYNLLGDPALRIAGSENGYEALTFDLWKNKVFSAEELRDNNISGSGADPDGDGVPNIVEYALARDPNTPGNKSLVFIVPSIDKPWLNDVVLSFTRLKNAISVSYDVELSTNLLTWQSGGMFITGTEVEDDGNGQTETVRVFIRSPQDDRGRCFMRLNIRSQ